VDDALAVDRLLVRPVQLSPPSGQRALIWLIWMNAPDLEVASLLVDRYPGIDVVVSRRGRPDFDYQ
jgi:hypothetical protein